MRLLCKYSKFFRAALESDFQEAHTKTIELPEDDEATIELFVHWLYGQTPFNRPSLAISEENPAALLRYLKLYVFGSKMIIPRLQNDVTTALHNFYKTPFHKAPCMEAVLYLYQNTTENSRTRDFIAETTARYLKRPLEAEKMPSAWADALKQSPELGRDIIGRLFNWSEHLFQPDAELEADQRLDVGLKEELFVTDD